MKCLADKSQDKLTRTGALQKYESIRRSMVRLHYPDLELKVSKFQKQIFLFSFDPKTERNYFFDFCPKDGKWVK